MITLLNELVDAVEHTLHDDIDVARLARAHGTTEYHARRMFSALANMSLSEYIRRRRMTLAATDLLGSATLLDIATSYGYTSAEAFTRAFRAVHGVHPTHVRRHGGPLRAQTTLRFQISVSGKDHMDTRIITQPAFRLVGYTARVPLIHEGVNEHIQRHIAALPMTAHAELKHLSNADPSGILQITDGGDPDYIEGTTLTYMHGVAVTADTQPPAAMDIIEVPAGTWAVFRATGAYPEQLQRTWAATASEWFPSNPWSLRPGPSLVAVIERAADFSTATTELWLPVERTHSD